MVLISGNLVREYVIVSSLTQWRPLCVLNSFYSIVSSHRFLHSQAGNRCSCEDDLEENIIYNSLLTKTSFLDKKREEKVEKSLTRALHSLKPTSVSLKYLAPFGIQNGTVQEDQAKDQSEYVVKLPYSLKNVGKNVLTEDNEVESRNVIKDVQSEKLEVGELVADLPTHTVGEWMNDYEKYVNEEGENESNLSTWNKDYGTAESRIPVSQVPCGGCGALLHCQDTSIPGFLPTEIFKNCSKEDLRETICQRCYFLKYYNTALSVTVDTAIYPKLIAKIKNEKVLVILIADVTDLPCSLWPDILNLIGPRNPIFLVGNKIDLLWGDRKGWLNHTTSVLRACLPSKAVVQHVSLLSAKTGFGVEELINKLHNFWQYKGDVYLIGCANVGKSTLFNSLLQSDYCKVKAIDLIQRATTAPWPGTTINLLKFPILRPEGWRLYLRTLRLKEERKRRAAEIRLKKEHKISEKRVTPQLVGHIGKTFFKKQPQDEVEAKDNFTMANRNLRFGLDPNDPDFAASRWVYDTPGVLHEEQILEYLTTEEISLTIPKSLIEPRTFSFHVGWSLFIAGLARIDFLKGNKRIKLTVFSSKELPITITEVQNADEIYSKLLGTQYFTVPQGPKERLDQWPGLGCAKEISLVGVDKEESCADVTLSSTGWVSITPEAEEIVKLRFWTPNGRGVFVRNPPLLPRAVALRGKRIRKTPAYHRTRPFIN